MSNVTKSEFARRAKVSAAAIGKAIKTGRLDIVGEGRKAKIDPNCYKSIQYLKGMDAQRHSQSTPGAVKKKIKPRPATRKPSSSKSSKDKQIKEKARADKAADKAAGKAAGKRTNIIIMPRTENLIPTGPKPAGELPELTPEEKEYARQMETLEKLGERYDIAKTGKMEEQEQKLKLENARIRGELVDREKVYNNIFMYLDKLHSNLERLADSFLSDLGPLMVDAGKVMPEHRESWHDEVLSQIDETKKGMVKMLKKIEKEQSK